MPRFVRYHAVIALGSLALKNTPPIPVTCSSGTSFPLAVVSPGSRSCNVAPVLVFVVAAATQSTATAPANAPRRRLLVSIFLFIVSFVSWGIEGENRRPTLIMRPMVRVSKCVVNGNERDCIRDHSWLQRGYP